MDVRVTGAEMERPRQGHMCNMHRIATSVFFLELIQRVSVLIVASRPWRGIYEGGLMDWEGQIDR